MGDPKDAHVDVVLETEHPFLKFRLESKDLPIGPDGELYFKNCGHPGFDVHFHLRDPNDLGYKFPSHQNRKDAIWSQVGQGACPKTSAVHEIFDPRKITPDQMTLVARNVNDKTAAFGYTLWVSKTGNPPYEDLDPGGFNQNGPSQAASNNLLLVIGGAIAGSLVTIGAQALLDG